MDFTGPLQDFPFLLQGLYTTLVVSAASIVIAGILGLGVAVVRLSRFRFVRTVGATYVVVIQSTPFFALLLWIYFVLPAAIGLKRPDVFIFGIAALVITYAPFYGETYRSGILAVPSGQREAALSTGMTERQAFRRVVLPQAFRSTLPPLTSLCVSAVKDSAVIGPVLGVQEIIWHASIIQGTTFRPAETFILAALLYVAITFPLTLVGNYLHRRSQGLATPSMLTAGFWRVGRADTSPAP